MVLKSSLDGTGQSPLSGSNGEGCSQCCQFAGMGEGYAHDIEAAGPGWHVWIGRGKMCWERAVHTVLAVAELYSPMIPLIP